MKPITWSFGMQSRPSFHVGENPDLEQVVKAAKDAGMTEAIIFGKDHTGLCFHPTNVGIQHPNCKINLTGDLTEKLHQNGLKAIAYANFGMDGEMGRRHREWLRCIRPGQPALLTEDHYCDCCPFTPYLEQYMIPMLLEMFVKYKVDGVFLDTMGAFDFCCCPDCQKAFQDTFNTPMPSIDDYGKRQDPAWKLYGPWHYERMKACIQRVRESILNVKPDATVIFNHVGGPLWPFNMPGVLEGPVSGDPQAYFPRISQYANYLSSLPHTGDVFIERFARGWGDRGANNDLTMQYKSAIIFMYRSRFCVGDRMHPDGRMGLGSKHAMQIISQTWKDMNQYLDKDMDPAPDFIMLYPEAMQAGKDRQKFPGSYWTDDNWIHVGAYRLFLDCGRSFMVAPEYIFNRHLKTGRVLVLPHVEYLRPESNQAIEDFLQRGGTVLALEVPPKLSDESYPKWLGVTLNQEEPVTNAVYLPQLDQDLPEDTEKTMVRGDILDLVPQEADVALRGFPQDSSQSLGKTNYSYYNSSANTPMDTPLLTRCKVGKGTVYLLNCRIARDYAACSAPDMRAWMAQLLRRIHPNAAFELASDSGNVEIASYLQKDGGTTHILLNHGGKEGAMDNSFKSEHVTFPQPAYRTTLNIRSQAPLAVTVNGQETETRFQDGVVSVDIIMDSLWKAVETRRK